MAKKTPKRPIGFGRLEEDSEKENRFVWKDDESDEPAEQPEEKPARLPKAEPVYVGTIEGLEILGAYGLSALAPLSNLEQQLLQVIAGLEKRIE